MKRLIVTLLIYFINIVFCSGQLDTKTKVYLIRPHDYLCCAIKMKIYINDTTKIKLKNKSIFTYETNKAAIKLRHKKQHYDLKVENGQTKYILLVYKMTFFGDEIRILELTEENAKKEIEKIN